MHGNNASFLSFLIFFSILVLILKSVQSKNIFQGKEIIN